MNERVASGLVIYRRLKEITEFLLLQTSYGQKHWTPPKGHLDEGEDHLTAAIRETHEEAGLVNEKDYKIVDDNFKIETSYLIDGVKLKKVLYWVARVNDPYVTIKLSDEHVDFKWLSIEPAKNIVGYEQTKKVIQDAYDFIENLHKNN